MTRRGACRRCGRCCVEATKFTYRFTRWILPDEPDWDTARVAKVNEGNLRACEKLVFDIRTREAVCLVQDSKPELCRRYPLSNADRLRGCGFIFRRTDG